MLKSTKAILSVRKIGLNFLSRLGCIKRRVSTTMKETPQDFETCRSQFIFDVQSIMELEEIPPQLVINWDHTGIHYVPVDNWTMEKEDCRRVVIAGYDDKQQITAMFAGTMTDKFLPLQIIYSGKNLKCLRTVPFLKDWDNTYTQNHWANEVTTREYIHKILLLYIEKKKNELGLMSDQPSLVIFDRLKGQCTKAILSLLKESNVCIAIASPKFTNHL